MLLQMNTATEDCDHVNVVIPGLMEMKQTTDVCMAEKNGANQESSMLQCVDGAMHIHTYNTLDCSGSYTSFSFSFYEMFMQNLSLNGSITIEYDCSYGKSCEYVLMRSQESNANCSYDGFQNDDSYSDNVYVTNECISVSMFGMSMKYECNSGVGKQSLYTNADCSGAPMSFKTAQSGEEVECEQGNTKEIFIQCSTSTASTILFNATIFVSFFMFLFIY